MALRLGALHDALLNAGASAELAQRAAEEVAGYESRLASIDTNLSVLKWMVGFLIALGLGMLSILWRLVTQLATP